MSRHLIILSAVVCICFMDTQVIFCRSVVTRGPVRGASLDDADLNAHRCLHAHDVGNINATFSNGGELGSPDGTPGFRGFEFPIGSGNDFLFSAGLWVGAQVNDVSCVSTTTDGDNGTRNADRFDPRCECGEDEKLIDGH